MTDIRITNKKIIDFYAQNPSLNVETVNLLVIELIDKVVNNDSKAFDSIQSQILANISDLKSSIQKELECAIVNSSSTNNDKIGQLFQQNVSQIIDKTSIMIHESLPKNDHLLQPICGSLTATEERIQKEISEIKNGLMSGALIGDLTEFFNKYKNSSYKGQLGERQLESTLNQIFPTAEVVNTSAIRASCDFRLNRTDKQSILFETKEYDRNVNLDEIKKFVRDIELQKHHGVFLSQHSGITSKQNFQIDLIGKCAVIYIHNVKYDPMIIRLAVDIIDNLGEKLRILNDDVPENKHSFSEDVFNDICAEYNDFAQKKLMFIETLKESQKRLLSLIDDMKFPALSKIITPTVQTIVHNDNTDIICTLCNKYHTTSNKSLAAHQRRCKKKMAEINDTIVVET
tara:strand:+ start:2625 stop:3827 length:1203 start_codon:yes stop_codon:yes gene_type:complete